MEQPARSLMQEHPRWRDLCRRVRVFRTHVWMGDFGAETPKPSWLYSQMQWIEQIKDRAKPAGNPNVPRLGLGPWVCDLCCELMLYAFVCFRGCSSTTVSLTDVV